MDTLTFPYPVGFFLGNEVVAEYPPGTQYTIRMRNPEEPRDISQIIVVQHEGDTIEYDMTEYYYQMTPPSPEA